MRETKWLRWKFPKSWFQKYGKVKFWEIFDEYVLSIYENATVVITGGDPFTLDPLLGTISLGSAMLIYSPLSGGLITIPSGSSVVLPDGQSLYVETKHPIKTATGALRAGSQKKARWHQTTPIGGRVGPTVYIRPDITVP